MGGLISLLPVLALFIVIALIIWAVLKGNDFYKDRAENELKRILYEHTRFNNPDFERIDLSFHTYYGLIFYVVETHHIVRLPAANARSLLEALHRFNLKWGFFAYGALIIPILSYLTYLNQRRLIKKQSKKLGTQIR